jgi:chemotaxis protein CheX
MTTDQSLPATTFRLPENLDLRGAARLGSELHALRGRAICLDASGVAHIGALCLQVLLSARITWKADGVPLTVVTPSTPFTDAMRLFGTTFLAD